MLLIGFTKITCKWKKLVIRKLPHELQQLLETYSVVFKVPKGLPPVRSHDNKIPFIYESQPFKVWPYRYPTVQKNELEKMVNEMLKTALFEIKQ